MSQGTFRGLARWLFGLHGGAVWLWLSLLVLIGDQISKQWIVDHLEYAEVIVVNGWFNVTRLHNTGAAFSFLADASGWQHWLFVGLGLVVATAILLWMRHLKQQAWLAAALALMLGGALGNVVDRVRYGYVVDFIHVHYEQWFWPAFNVADSALTVGAVMLVVESFLVRGREARTTRKAAAGRAKASAAGRETSRGGD